MPGQGRPGAVKRHPRHRRPQSALAGLGLVWAACGLALTACGGASGTPAGHPAGPQAPASHSAGPQTPVSLRARIDGAQYPAGYLLKTTSSQPGPRGKGPPSVTTVWTDPANDNAVMRQGSGPSRTANWERNYYQGRVLHWAQTQVNYGPRTWWAADAHANAPVKGAVPKGPVGGAYTPGAVVGQVLDKVPSQVVGYPVIDGRPTIELSATASEQKFDFWVDSGTYRVIRTEHDYLGALHIPSVTSDYDWVRSSPDLVKFINDPEVPSGFTRVQPGQRSTSGSRQ